MAKTSKNGSKMSQYGSKMKGARKVENKKSKYGPKMRAGRKAERSSKMSSKMTPTFNELVQKKTGGKV